VLKTTSGRAIVAAIVFLARNLKLSTVAVGIEKKEELEFLQKTGCQQYQGFFFSRPVPSTEIVGLLSQKS
jgi:EAL domain-containing protein (putative c-di-GMP-specific phosphodiesterase class I)